MRLAFAVLLSLYSTLSFGAQLNCWDDKVSLSVDLETLSATFTDSAAENKLVIKDHYIEQSGVGPIVFDNGLLVSAIDENGQLSAGLIFNGKTYSNLSCSID